MADCTTPWTDRIWQPVAPGTGHHAGRVTLHEDRIDQPYRWKKTGRVLVGDLFHHRVPDGFITRVFDAMEAPPNREHTFLVLTEHPGRMRDFVQQRETRRQRYAAKFDHCPTEAMRTSPAAQEARTRAGKPPANIWLGARVEDQRAADLRIPALLETPAAARFLVCEPLTGPVDLHDYLSELRDVTDPYADAPEGAIVDGMERHGEQWHRIARLHWVIAGGGSGTGARPLHPQWVRDIRDACARTDVAFYFTQHGEYRAVPVVDDPNFSGGRAYDNPLHGGRSSATIRERGPSHTFRAATTRLLRPGERTRSTWLLDENTIAVRVGKAAAGRELDDRLHNAVPSRPLGSDSPIMVPGDTACMASPLRPPAQRPCESCPYRRDVPAGI
ncbi:DUF5131 family protein [Streptomyces bobili]|uniref:DUF5131 family protein n=1 Tax=Streptomyces bobili TaxID=67280 RepID=UPI00342215A8